MNKYKIKLLDNRILGPLTEDELRQLHADGRISADQKIQKFPEGEWTVFKEISKSLNLNSTNSAEEMEETHLINLKEILNQKETESLVEENNTLKNEDVKEFEFDKTDLEIESISEDEKIDQTPEDSHKTQVRVGRNEENDEKTKINLEYKKYLESLELAKESADQEELKNEAEKLKADIRVDYENESTQILSKDSRSEIQDEVILVEAELESELQDVKNVKADIKASKAKESAVTKTEKVGKKKSKFVTILAVFLILYLVLDKDEEIPKKGLKEIVLIEPKINFPTQFDVSDKEKAQQLYALGIKEENKQTYDSLVRANVLYRKAMENDFQNNTIAAKFIFSSSELLKSSTKFNYHANLIFKLVQIFKDKALESPNMASAISYFYYIIDKPKASLKIFDMYMTLNQKKATIQLFTIRLLSLIETGDLENANITAKKLEKVKEKDIFLVKALYRYYGLNELTDKKVQLLKNSLEKNKDNAFLNIEKGNVFVSSGNIPEVKKIILKLNKNNVEGSREYYGRYLVLKGMYHALSGEVKKAVVNFKSSLKIKGSVELIEKLASLEENEDEDINSIILIGKSKSSILKAKEFIKNNNFEAAMKIIIEASSINPNNLELRLFLAKLQIKRGYIQDAIEQLEELYKVHASSTDLLFALIEAYTQAYKYKRVLELLNIAQNIDGIKEDLFYSAKAKLALYQGDYNSASGWLQRAVNANPLNDQNIFELAKLYIKYHRYEKGKSILKRAMDLDPSEVDYNIIFAEILYETETSSSAIGYLYDVLKDFPDSPKILSKIGIYFYRSGQLKKYEAIKKQLLEIPEKHKSLYEFLIESARLDDDLAKIIEYSILLLEIDPGDLKVRMQLAQNYMNMQEYKSAKKQLDIIEKRLETYPKLQYLYAKLYYYVDDIDKARILVNKEIESNPNVVDGYILLADILIKEKNLNAAKVQYLKALKIDPRSVDAILGVAFVAFQNDQYNMALDQYQKVTEIDSNMPKVYKLLGDAYRKLGQSQLAIKNYKYFLELSPNTKYKNSINTCLLYTSPSPRD